MYRIYNPEIKLANKKFTKVQNDYRLIMKEHVSDIKIIKNESEQNPSTKKDISNENYQYKFVKLSTILLTNNIN